MGLQPRNACNQPCTGRNLPLHPAGRIWQQAAPRAATVLKHRPYRSADQKGYPMSPMLAERRTELPLSPEPPAPPAPPQQAFIKRHPVLSYYLLTFAISWGGMLLVIIGGQSSMPATQEQFDRLLPFAIPFLLLGPGVATIILTGLVDGKAGYRELLARLLRSRVGAGWYAVALLTAPLAFTAVALALSLTSAVYLPGIVTASDKTAFLLVGLAPALLVGFFEELGWTGFAIPRLRLRHSVLATGLLVVVLWGARHLLSNDLWAGNTISGELPVALVVTVNGISLLVGQLLAYRVLMVWVYDRTGSLLVGMLMHVGFAFSTFVLQPPGLSGMAFLIYSVGVAVMLWVVVAAVALGNRKQPAPRPLRIEVA
jgi:membrane protease YdiL (CAAX protease family)